MSNKKSFFYLLAMLFCVLGFSQKLEGKWETIDDETGKAKSVIEIYSNNGKYYGKVVKLLLKEDQGKICTNCSGNKKNQPVVGLEILEGLSKDGDKYTGGKILDPKNGKTYKCQIEFNNDNEIKVRGFIGISLIGRSQIWKRVS